MRELVSEAGDPAVAPRPEYVAGLRETIFNHLDSPRLARRRARLLIGSGFATAAVVAAALTISLFRPSNAWALVAKALQAQAWVHSRALGPDGKEVSEGWFSPRNRVIASRYGAEVEYHDTSLRTFTRYVPAEETVYRLPEQNDRLSMGMAFYQVLLDPKGPSKSPLPGTDLIAQNRRKVEEGGRTWENVDLTLRVIGGDRELRMRFRLDARTGLPHSYVFQSAEGLIETTLFDYPDHGPADIYDLGAPRTAKRVDRAPGDDLDLVLAGLKVGRLRFDDYRGVMDWSNGTNAWQVYRKGRKWRVESLRNRKAIPQDADAAWWRKNLDLFTREVSAICDGERVYYYRAEGNIFGKDARVPKVKLHMTQALNLSDEPLMPWPDKFPEHISRTNIWQPSHDREILLEPKPDDGPPGTIRLQVRDTRSSDPNHSDLYKLWLDPAAGYIALRSETSVFKSTNPPKLAFIDTMLMENLARSPSGFWYPTQVRRKTSEFDSEQVWKYFLDFEAPIPNDLFLPLR